MEEYFESRSEEDVKPISKGDSSESFTSLEEIEPTTIEEAMENRLFQLGGKDTAI